MDAARWICIFMILCLIPCFIWNGVSFVTDHCGNYDISGECESKEKCTKYFRFWYGSDHVGYAFCDYDEMSAYICYFCHEAPPPESPPEQAPMAELEEESAMEGKTEQVTEQKQESEQAAEEEQHESDSHLTELQKEDGGSDEEEMVNLEP